MPRRRKRPQERSEPPEAPEAAPGAGCARAPEPGAPTGRHGSSGGFSVLANLIAFFHAGATDPHVPVSLSNADDDRVLLTKECAVVVAALRLAEADLAWSGKAWRDHTPDAHRTEKRDALRRARIAFRAATDAAS